MKRVTLRTSNEDEVTFIGERSNHLSNVISVATARKMVRKGYEAYLAYVIDMVKARPSISYIPTVSDFPISLLGFWGLLCFFPSFVFFFSSFPTLLARLWACQFGFTEFIPSFPSLPSGSPIVALVEQLTKSYQTPTCGLNTIMLSNVESFSAWRFVRFDELIRSCPSSSGIWIYVHCFLHSVL